MHYSGTITASLCLLLLLARPGGAVKRVVPNGEDACLKAGWRWCARGAATSDVAASHAMRALGAQTTARARSYALPPSWLRATGRLSATATPRSCVPASAPPPRRAPLRWPAASGARQPPTVGPPRSARRWRRWYSSRRARLLADRPALVPAPRRCRATLSTAPFWRLLLLRCVGGCGERGTHTLSIFESRCTPSGSLWRCPLVAGRMDYRISQARAGSHVRVWNLLTWTLAAPRDPVPPPLRRRLGIGAAGWWRRDSWLYGLRRWRWRTGRSSA